MIAIIIQTIKRKKVSIFIYCLACLLFLTMYVAMYPAIGEQAAQLEEAFKAYPQDLFKAFNIDSLSFDSLEKYLALENFSIIWPLMVLFLMTAFAGTNLAGEVEKGTLGLVLSRPISRLKIFIAKYLAGVVALLIFTFFSIFFVIPLAKIFNIEYNFTGQMYMLALGVLFGWAVYSLAMFISSIVSEKSKVYMFMGGTFFLMYILNVAANLRESLDELKYSSFFYYFDFNSALLDHTIHWETFIVFGATIIITFIASMYIFKRRDIII